MLRAGRPASTRPDPPRRIIPMLTCFAACLFLAAGCSERKRVTIEEPPEADWRLGTPSVYQVAAEAGATVADSISGGTFRFPDGGGGELTIAPVLEGPRMLESEGVFHVEYSGPGPVEFLMPDDPQATEYLLSWESHDDMILEGEEPDGHSWLPMQDAGSAGTCVFSLPLDAAGKLSPGRWSGVPTFKPLRVVAGAPHDTLTRRFEQNIRDAANALINKIPPARRPDVIASANG